MGQEFEVEEICDFREYDTDEEPVIEYKVKWKGYSEKDSTWEPLESLETDRGTAKKVKAYNTNYAERIVYKIKKYKSKGVHGIERCTHYKQLLKERDYFLNGGHIKARARKRSRHRERESSDDDSNVACVDDAFDAAREDREFQKYLLEQQRERERDEARRQEEIRKKKLESQKRAIPKAFLEANVPDVKKGKLDSKNTGELKNYERLVMESNRRGMKIPNVLHEF